MSAGYAFPLLSMLAFGISCILVARLVFLILAFRQMVLRYLTA